LSREGTEDANRRFREAATPIFKFHKAVRSVSVIRMDGTRPYSVVREGVTRLEPEQVVSEVLLKFAMGKGMTEAEDKYYGVMKSIAISREKVKHLVYPKPDGILVVSTEPGFPMEKVDALSKLVITLRDW